MAIQTPLDICDAALIRSGVIGDGQTASADQINRAFGQLNGIISLWNRRRWLVWAEVDISCVATGAQSLTIGPGQSFDVARPDRIEAAYVRLLPVVGGQPYDKPLYIIESHEDYIRIGVKQISTYPSAVFYDSQYPVGNLLFWPVPPANQYEMHVLVKNVITPFATLTEGVVAEVPPEYLEALIWNLAVYLRPAYQLPPDETITALANGTLQTIRIANIQVPTLTPPNYYGRGGVRANGLYSWLTGGLA
jgi:hypothetical protein